MTACTTTVVTVVLLTSLVSSNYDVWRPQSVKRYASPDYYGTGVVDGRKTSYAEVPPDPSEDFDDDANYDIDDIDDDDNDDDDDDSRDQSPTQNGRDDQLDQDDPGNWNLPIVWKKLKSIYRRNNNTRTRRTNPYPYAFRPVTNARIFPLFPRGIRLQTENLYTRPGCVFFYIL